jgi:hypothetical protein
MHQPIAAARMTYESMLSTTDAQPQGDAWRNLADKIALAQDPGASTALISSVRAGLGRFDPASLLAHAAGLVQVIAHVMAQPQWSNGQWMATANPSRAGDRFAGSVMDRPILAGLVSRPLLSAPEGQATVDGVRLVLVIALLKGRDVGTAAAIVADGLRKAARFHDWRQVVLAIPAPPPSSPFDVWVMAVGEHLRTARVPQGIAQAPEYSIREFFESLSSLAATALDDKSRARRQPALFDADSDEAGTVGQVRRHRDAGVSRVSRRAASKRSANPENADRTPPIQEALFFDEAVDATTEPAALPLTTVSAVCAGEQPQSAPAQAVEHRFGSYRLVELNQRLRWSWEHANRHDLSIVRASIRSDIAAPGPRHQGALLAAAMLATGRRVSDVACFRLREGRTGEDYVDSQGRWHRAITRPHKAWRAAPSLQEFLQPIIDVVVLDLPKHLRAALVGLMAAHPDALTLGDALALSDDTVLDALSRWLDPLRLSHPTSRLTHGRLARALAVEISAQAAGNEVVVHSLTGMAEDVPPIASYYTAAPVAALQQIYQRAVCDLFEESPSLAAPLAAVGYAGPALLSGGARRTIAEALRDRLARSATAGVVDQHNAFALYVVWMLMVACGHRPVTDPFESLDMFDLDRGFVLIADKFVHAPNQARLVPLPSLVAEMVRSYLDHLAKLSGLLRHEHPALAARIVSATQANGVRALPMFFLLTPEYEVERISERVLAESLGAAFADLPPNHFRRELSSYAAAHDWPYELVREMLGHVDLGQPAFGGLSCLGPQDLHAIRCQLDDYLVEFGWQRMDSPLVCKPPARSNSTARGSPSAMAMGTALRQRQLERAHQRTRDRIEAVLRAWCRRRVWPSLTQESVDTLYRDARQGRDHPNSVAELAALDRIDCLLHWIKRRYDLQTLKLPATRRTLEVPQATFEVGALRHSSVADALRGAFVRVMFARARASPRGPQGGTRAGLRRSVGELVSLQPRRRRVHAARSAAPVSLHVGVRARARPPVGGSGRRSCGER